MKSKLLYSALFFMSAFILFAQEESFICEFEEEPNSLPFVYFSPMNNPVYSLLTLLIWQLLSL